MTLQLRINLLHMIDYEVRNLIEECALELEGVVTLINRAAHYLAKHVVASLVAGKNSIRDCKRGRARVISDDAHGKTFLGFRLVIAIGQTRSEVDYWSNQICIVV